MTSTWTPEILDEDVPADAERLEELRDDPGIDFLDERATQRAGLSALKSIPNSTFSAGADRWVYYPWRRTVVALLGPDSFRILRTDRNRNKISSHEQKTLSRLTIGVIGLSVGHAIAHTLALEGICGELRLADFDEIELSNLNRIPGSVLDLGVNKAVVAAQRIAEVDPYLKVHIFPQGIIDDTIDAFFDGLDILIEECDSLDIKVRAREAARHRRIPVLMETSDRGLLDVERFDLEPDREIFHGVLGKVDSSALSGLSVREKIPIVLDQLDASLLSARMAASMVEVGETIETWPQLGGDVQLGGATVAAAVRRLGTGQPLPSGRIRVDLDQHLDGLSSPKLPASRAPHPETTDQPGSPDTPHRPVAHDLLAEAVRRAPSGGNTQPWSASRNGDVLTIALDPSTTSALDIELRGSRVALGAAAYNARVAAAHLGRSVETTVSDDAVIVQMTDAEPDTGLAGLFEAMMNRSTNRNYGTGKHGLTDQQHAALADAAEAEGARVVVLADSAHIRCAANILAASDRARYLTPRLHREMMSELRWPGDAQPNTGIDIHSLGMDIADLSKLDIIRRLDVMSLLKDWDAGQALGSDTVDRVHSCAALAVVLVSGSDAQDYIKGGSATQRVWIAAEMTDLAVQPVSPVFLYAHSANDIETLSGEFSELLLGLQQQFEELVGHSENESAALVLRLSDAPKQVIRSRRRP